MAKLNTDSATAVSFWAVARLAGAAQVAIKFNDLPPVLMGLEEAKEFAAAVQCSDPSEIGLLSLA